MDFSADCTILTAMISRVQSYEKLKSNFPAVLHDLECDTLILHYVIGYASNPLNIDDPSVAVG